MQYLFAILTFCFTSLIKITSCLDQHDQGTSIDHLALVAIKSQITLDSHGVLNSWNDSLHFCQWQGVICAAANNHQKTQRVVALHLSSKGLVGTLSPAVGNLSFLHHINISNTNFRGHIPPQIGHLFRLRSLSLQNNSFEGEIPANISRCLNLEILALGGNNFNGNIPPELGRLSKLHFLSLQLNRFTGKLNIVANLSSLRIFSASINSFQGSIPYDIGLCKKLTFIGVAQNHIVGTIPPSFYNLSSLQTISLSGNRLEGSLPLDIGSRFPQLNYFQIGENFFKGHIPISLSNLTQLVDLSMYSNNFTGKLMFNAKNMPNLLRFDVAENSLGTGEDGDLDFLQNFVNCSYLQMLGCGFNNFGGNLPNFLGNLSTELQIIDFQFNQIIGTIPSSLFNLINLEKLRLSSNRLIGDIPFEIGKLKRLIFFSCDINFIAGNIPSSFGNLSLLSEIYMEDNNLEGKLPSSLGNCTYLQVLSLSDNNLSGELPSHLSHASTLLEIYLEHNHLQGIIPVEIGYLENLVSLYVSQNAFSGVIPSSLGGCITLSELEMGENFFTGSIPETFKSLVNLEHLNLSHNRLSGQIPNFLSNISLISLDLSFNNFVGEVPKQGPFANISAVSIAGNSKLCGGISELHLPRCRASTKRQRRKLSTVVIICIAAACFVVSVAIVSIIYILCCQKRANKLSQSWSLRKPFPKVSYDMLLDATNRFSEANLLGKGAFGSVFKGVLGSERMVVAIKVINLEHEGAKKSFMAECKVLRNVRHRNLLKIVTACSSIDVQGNDFKALVYDFMPNGNLQQWIHDDSTMDDKHHGRLSLSLLQRLNIAIDVASAVDYLHNSHDVLIIHGDLKPSNILLDNDMVAHVGDFGLTRFHSNAGTASTSSVAVKGTVGYAAPEYGLGNMVSKEGDVYSFGIMLIEMMTSKRPTDSLFDGGLNLHEYAKSALPYQVTKIVDPRLVDDGVGASHGYDNEIVQGSGRKFECIKSIIEIGLDCSVESPQDRMTIDIAIRNLQSTRDIFFFET